MTTPVERGARHWVVYALLTVVGILVPLGLVMVYSASFVDAFTTRGSQLYYTWRQLIAAGFPFCSLQATTQHLQPMHFVMSKWKRYCSPG